MAANMGALAESFGLRQGLKYRGAINGATLTCIKLPESGRNLRNDLALQPIWRGLQPFSDRLRCRW